jgi:hypothetical protein
LTFFFDYAILPSGRKINNYKNKTKKMSNTIKNIYYNLRIIFKILANLRQNKILIVSGDNDDYVSMFPVVAGKSREPHIFSLLTAGVLSFANYLNKSRDYFRSALGEIIDRNLNNMMKETSDFLDMLDKNKNEKSDDLITEEQYKNHDCHNTPGDGCEVCQKYEEQKIKRS